MSDKPTSSKREAIIRILKKKLTQEPGRQPTVVENEEELEREEAIGLYDPKTHKVTLGTQSEPNVIAHELQHSIDVEQVKKARDNKQRLPSRPDARYRMGHTEKLGELMSAVLKPGMPKDKELALEARGNLETRQALLDEETKNWLASKAGIIGKVPIIKEIIKEQATTSEEMGIEPEKLIMDKPPVTFKEALAEEMAKLKKEKKK